MRLRGGIASPWEWSRSCFNSAAIEATSDRSITDQVASQRFSQSIDALCVKLSAESRISPCPNCATR